MEMEKPQIITNSDLVTEYWFERLVKEQERTNELLESLLASLVSKPKPTRKKKGDENE